MAYPRHFEYWYYHWGDGMRNLLHGECAGMYQNYLEMTMSWCSDEGCYVGSVVDCLLGNSRESWKANSTYPRRRNRLRTWFKKRSKLIVISLSSGISRSGFESPTYDTSCRRTT
jgi:hypothetical protein